MRADPWMEASVKGLEMTLKENMALRRVEGPIQDISQKLSSKDMEKSSTKKEGQQSQYAGG